MTLLHSLEKRSLLTWWVSEKTGLSRNNGIFPHKNTTTGQRLNEKLAGHCTMPGMKQAFSTFMSYLWDRVLLHSPGWVQTYYVVQTGFELVILLLAPQACQQSLELFLSLLDTFICPLHAGLFLRDSGPILTLKVLNTYVLTSHYSIKYTNKTPTVAHCRHYLCYQG